MCRWCHLSPLSRASWCRRCVCRWCNLSPLSKASWCSRSLVCWLDIFLFPLSLSRASWCSCSLSSWYERTLSPWSRASWGRCCVCRWCQLSFLSRSRHTCIKVIRICPYSWTSSIWSFPFYWTSLNYSLLAFVSWQFSPSRNRLSFIMVNNELLVVFGCRFCPDRLSFMAG